MPFPLLREELALHAGPRLSDGQPTWTVHDPVRNQFFQIDWLTFEILSRWSIGDARAIVDTIARETTLHPETDDVEVVAKFLVENQLTQPDANGAAGFAARLAAMRGSWSTWLLHHYLFFRIPLIRPDGWLTRSVAKVDMFYRPAFFKLTLLVLLAGLVLVYRDWDRFAATLVDLFTWRGLLAYGVALIGVKMLHELGHAFTAKRYGCRVPAMGVAFLVLWPVAYTDTNEVWKLADRKQRLAVAAAGVATELLIAAWATLAWALLPEGLPRSVAFVLATTTWIMTLAINASPFMRFDGYFLLSDWLEMPNLHARAFALARWDLRERLFDLGEAPPEQFSRQRARGLILFAYATWVYRLALFLGIAVLVYHFFIKAVGILLFVVEIGWFVLLPVWKEISAWCDRWPALRARPRAQRTAIAAVAIFTLFFVPWPARTSSSGYLRPAEIYPVHAPEGAQVVALPVKNGAVARAGEVMLQLASPELELRWRRATAVVETVRGQVLSAGVSAAQRPDMPVLEERLATAQAELASVQAALEKYAPRAPFDGELRDIDPDLKLGAWVGRGERIAVLVQPGKWRVETYVDEDALRRIRVGDRARFYADGLEGPNLALTVEEVDRDATRILTSGLLAAPFGGSIVTREKHGQLIPERAVYRVTLVASDPPGSLKSQSWRGVVVIRGAWEAPGLGAARSMLAAIWREAGF